jgi:thiol-disulfide isomerase/thioredoxin
MRRIALSSHYVGPLLWAALGICLLGAPLSVAQNSAVDLAGDPVDPLQNNAEKIVVLVFVRTDCPVSNRYAPLIQRLSSQYAGKAAFWLVYPSQTESADAIRKYLQDYGYNLPALRDPRHWLVARAQAEVTPEAAVFRSGQLIYHGRIDNWYEDFGRRRRAATTHELDEAIRAALSGHAPAKAATRAVGCYIADLQ